MQTIKFNRNHNHKLSCLYFSTIRLADDKKFKVGNKFKILLNNEVLKHVELKSVKYIYADQISDTMAYLDAGMNARSFKKMLRDFYGKYHADLEYMQFVFLILKTI